MLKQKLLEIAQAWLDPRYKLRQEALTQAAPEFCLSGANFELALDWIFSLWTESTIETKLASLPYQNHRYAVQVLAGTTPAMIAQGFLQGALLQLPQCLKIPALQPGFARLLYQSFLELAPDVARLFELNLGDKDLPRFYERLRQADLVFIYGQDQTVSTLKKLISSHALLVAHGHAESAAVIFKEAAENSSLEKLAYDFLSYDQRGCLSPSVVLVEQGGALNPAACAQIFAETFLPPFAHRLPRGGLFPGEAAAILHQRNLYRFRGQVYCGEDWTVCYDEKSGWPETRLPRFLPFKAFEAIADLRDLLNSVQQNLICVGYAGSETRLNELCLDSDTRRCSLGEMQKQLLIF